MDPGVNYIDSIQRKVEFCAKDSGIESANLQKLIPFSLEEQECVQEAAKLLTINFVHVLKSPVIVTHTFVQSVVSFILSQPKNIFTKDNTPQQQQDGASSSSSSSSPSSSSSSSSSPVALSPTNSIKNYPINCHHMVESMSTMDTIRALCLSGLFYNIQFASEMANQIIQALNGEGDLNIPEMNSFYDISKVFPALPYSYGALREKEPGAWIYDSSIGPIQVGIPPETIKTSMKNNETVPKIYVLPHIMCASGGVSYGEVEFPIYFNFFIKKAMSNPESRVVMIGHQAQLKRVQTIFKESMFGPNPDEIFINDEIAQDKKDSGYSVDFLAERSTLAFKGPSGKEVTIEDFAQFVAFDGNGVATTKGTRQRKRKQISGDSDEDSTQIDSPTTEIRVVNSGGLIKFYEDGVLRGTVDSSLPPPIKHVKVFPSLPSPFIAPTLGVTFLGTSHGFDPNGSTTGFIVWVNGHGILVDPPPHTGQYLMQHGISPHRVNTVILTHCHSDHDSGILQRILEGGKIDLYTTNTINESYKRKARATTGRSDIESYYNWVSVQIGPVMKIHGASFEFDYSLHTIPTIRFRMRFQGKSISYSADTKYDPVCYAQLLTLGTINVMREAALRMFVFDADLIIHESGVPPIHTDATELDALPPSVKSKLYVVHTHKIPDTVMRGGKKCKVEGLRIPKEGLENTIALNVGDFCEGFSKALRRFRLFCEGFIFRKLAPETLYKLVCAAEELLVPAGTEIISQGDHSDRIYMLEAGQVQVTISGNCQDILTVGAIFGENALVQSHKMNRSASVTALTDVYLLVLENTTYFKVTEGDELSIEKDIGKIAKHVAFLQTALTRAFPEMGLTKPQLEAFAASIDKQSTFSKDSVIIREGETDTSMFIVKEGSIRLERFSKEIRRLMPGDCFGEISLLTGLPRTATAIANEDCVLLELKREAFQDLMERYQHIRFHVVQMMEQRLVEGKRLNYTIQKEQDQ